MELVREYLDGEEKNGYVYKFDNGKLKKIFDKYDIKDCIKKHMQKIVKPKKKIKFHLNLQNTLATLIYRYTLPINLPKVDILQGPMSCYKFIHTTLPHIIYAFGDCHINQNECQDKMSIPDLLKMYSHNAPIFLDIFLETSYKHKTTYFSKDMKTSIFGNNYMFQIYNSFDKSCWSALKEGCNENTTRLHYTDFRKFYANEQEYQILTILENFSVFQLMSQGIKNPYSQIKYERIKQETISKFKSNKDFDSFYKSIKDNIRNDFKYIRVMKQIQNIPNENIRDMLTKLFNKKVDTEIKNLPVVNFLKLQTESNEKIEKVCANVFNTLVIDFYMIFMDYYLIARILRTFLQIPNKYSKPCYNSIIYAGDAHIGNYKNILTSLGFKIVEQTYNGFTPDCKNTQCLNMKNITQPLFSTRF